MRRYGRGSTRCWWWRRCRRRRGWRLRVRWWCSTATGAVASHGEYRRVRREWRVLRDRWQDGGRARAYGELPGGGGRSRAGACRLGDRRLHPGGVGLRDRGRGRGRGGRPAAGGERRASRCRPRRAAGREVRRPVRPAMTGGAAPGAGGTAGGLGLDEPLALDDAARDAAAERGGGRRRRRCPGAGRDGRGRPRGRDRRRGRCCSPGRFAGRFGGWSGGGRGCALNGAVA